MKRCLLTLAAGLAATAAHDAVRFAIIATGLAKLRADAPECFQIDQAEFDAHIAEIAKELGY